MKLLIRLCSCFLLLGFLAQSGSGEEASVDGHNPDGPNADLSKQIGIFASGGFAPYHTIHGPLEYDERLDFYTAGLEAGAIVTTLHGPGWIRGNAEFLGEVRPLWYARVPKQTIHFRSYLDQQGLVTLGPFGWSGVAVTPLLLRWNLTPRHRFLSPYGQLGGGLLWTARKFPQGSNQKTTSRINFTPQAELGLNVFTGRRESLFTGIRVEHISSAGIGDVNPGVNVTVQFRLGYTWWR